MSTRVLSVPPVCYPYYWELQVSSSSVWVRLCRRPFGLGRNAICAKSMELVSHGDAIDDEVLDEIEDKMRRIHGDVVGDLTAALAAHVPGGVKVKADR